MREITLQIYSFEELSEEAKQKALDNHRFSSVECYEWWEHVYEEAARDGVAIREFNTYNSSIHLVIQDIEKLIANRHDEFALMLMAELDEEKADPYYDDYSHAFHVAAETYCKKYYLNALQTEYDYLTSDSIVAEFLDANDYSFLEDGRDWWG